jgi:TonB-linked SusC/RagA family outer membrane protein
MLGYRVLSREVAVGSTDLRLELTELAVALDDIVVTGTPGGTQRRALGHAVTSLDVGNLYELAPAQDLSQLLNARVPGVVFQPGSGSAGSGGRVRIRGSGSLTLGNEPLVYIDGVRVDNSSDRGFSFNEVSRFNDIDPATIESIEIIKGPAAATLYGTEAANGVIQIITKRGQAGAPRITVSMETGTNAVVNPEGRFRTGYLRDGSGQVESLNLMQFESERGTPIFRTGQVGRYGVEVSGGNEGIRYFLNTSYENEEGVLDPNEVQRYRAQLNLDAVVTETVFASASAGYVSSTNESAHSEILRGASMPMAVMLETPFRGHLFGPPEAFREAYSLTEDLTRFTGNIEVRHTPTAWLSHRLRVGVDEVRESATSLVPRLRDEIAIFFGATALGEKSINGRSRTGTTIDYSATASSALNESIGSESSVGIQFFRDMTITTSISGQQFPAPGVTSISSTATRTTSENSVENVTLGFYVQQQFDWNSRLFITGAVRADDNSAFGDNFDLVAYPKVSAAWVVSEESFWNVGAVNTLRLRGAYGQSGLQPQSFAALRTYAAVVGPNGTAAIAPQGVGNPDLKPERGSEVELGFEAGLLDDRLAVDFTVYDKRTRDGILSRATAPSEGFTGARFVNVGEIRNRGFELGLNIVPWVSENVLVDLNLNLSRNDNKILDLGDLEAATALVNQQHRVGYPVAGFFERRVVSAEIGPEGQILNAMCDGGPENNHAPVSCAGAPQVYLGQPNPKWEGAIISGVTLFNSLRLSALFDFKVGHRVFNSDVAVACTILTICEENVFPERNPLAAAEMSFFAFGPFNTPDASFGRLRQVSMSYQLPSRWAGRVRASAASVNVSFRNLLTFTDFPGPDPENTRQAGSQHFYSAFQAAPHPLQFRTGVRLTY